MERATTNEAAYDTALALIGMSGRFPGARTVAEFWQNIAGGVNSIRFFSDAELLNAGVDPALLQRPDYVKAGTLIEGVERFDASFFGYTPREAELMDPQQRLFLECAWEALEDAAYDPETNQQLIGIFGGSAFCSYLINNIYPDSELMKRLDTLQIAVGNERDALVSNVAYKLNLRGPTLAVQTFCSTSLVAVHLACQSLLNYECDMALAGGVALQFPHLSGYVYKEGGIVSPDGFCRTFDAQGRGSVMGNGVGVVLLKRLNEALEDGDHIYAVIRGSAVNNDGSLRVSGTAPGLEGQTSVIAEALGNAGLPVESIRYIEAHGTATELGDAVELAAMMNAFEPLTQRTQFCALGSVKPNVGHLDRAAGVTGLIKTALALQQKQLPPSLNFTHTSPDIDLAQSPFYVNTQLSAWPETETPRRAGVSSFGLGGTNAHVILEEAPPLPESSPTRPAQLLLLSAKSENALARMSANLAAHLRAHPAQALADVAFTLQTGRSTFAYRQALVCAERTEAIAALEDGSKLLSAHEAYRERPVVFLLPGLGEQYAGQVQELYQQEAAFRAEIDTCCLLLQEHLDLDLRTILLAPEQAASGGQPGLDLRAMLGRGGTQSAGESALKRTELAQPAVFVVEYALAKLLMSWGIRPVALLGYSLGEYVAACLAGVLTLEDALLLVARRARLIEAQPAGAMLAVTLSAEEVQPYVGERVSLAVINGPRTCVLAGTPDALAEVEKRLLAQEIACRRVETTHAFHSTLLAPVSEALTKLVRTLTLNEPQIPYISNVTGTWITAEQATDASYWAQHMCQTVHFSAGVGQVLQEADWLLLEVGPGQALGSFVRQHPACDRARMGRVLATLPTAYERQSALSYLLTTLGKLWLAGVAIDWRGFAADERRLRLALPTYPFERERYWIEPVQTRRSVAVTEINVHDEPERLADLADWFYTPCWKQTPPLQVAATPRSTDEAHCWLILLAEDGPGERLVQRLRTLGQQVITVREAQAFAQTGEGVYTVRAEQRGDYEALLKELHAHGRMPDRVVHLWMVTDEAAFDESEEQTAELVRRGFFGLLALAQALGALELEQCEITVISNGLHDVRGDETLCPAKATLIGPCRVIPQEYAHLRCRSVDLPWSSPVTEAALELLLAELFSPANETLVALRGRHRWIQDFAPLRLEQEIEHESRLRVSGVYLITGGLGGIGLAVADYLVRTWQASVVLTSRSGLPTREEWPHILETQDASSSVARQIRQIVDMEAAGGKVLVLKADVADEARMREVVEQTLATFGALHGVIHTAGQPGIGLMQLKTAEEAAQVLAAKVQGTLVLRRVLRDMPLDFLALFSSMTSITSGGPGQVDYCAANAFLDAYAQRYSTEHGLTIAIGWGEWQWNAWENGLAGYDQAAQTYFRAHRAEFGISFAEGVTAFGRLLATRLPYAIVSSQEFRAMVARSKFFSAATLLKMAREARQQQAVHPRPDLGSSYVAPRNEREQQITGIWEELLGITPVGIEDNFFELGGNSLTGVELITRLRKLLQVETLAAHVLYEAPTVSAMSAYIEQAQTTVSVEEWQDRSTRRREGLRQRVREAGRAR